ncbi:MAG: metallophosphoesterase, partial [Bacilli bacterium]|nr:metallophosphoesterase [Bacilli bacterium]
DHSSHSKVWYDSLREIFPDKKFYYDGGWFVQIGDTIFCHPTAFKSGILATAEKAMYWFRNEGYMFKNLVMSHTHRSGEYVIGNTTIIEQGTCSDVVRNNYRDGMLVNEQKEGFVYLCQDDSGKTIAEMTQRVVLN